MLTLLFESIIIFITIVILGPILTIASATLILIDIYLLIVETYRQILIYASELMKKIKKLIKIN